MSDYSNSFNGAGKDAGNDIIYGADIDTQLDNVATASTSKANKIVPATTGNVAKLSATGDLQDSGYTFTNMTGAVTATHTELNIMDGVTASTAEINGLAGITVANIPSGTKMLFQQTAAPTGWTKDVVHNDKVLRIVSGTAASGGTTAFSGVATASVNGHALSIAEMPAHTHTYNGVTDTQGVDWDATSGNAEYLGTGLTSGSTGSGNTHNHTLGLDLQYVDIIIATKD